MIGYPARWLLMMAEQIKFMTSKMEDLSKKHRFKGKVNDSDGTAIESCDDGFQYDYRLT